MRESSPFALRFRRGLPFLRGTIDNYEGYGEGNEDQCANWKKHAEKNVPKLVCKHPHVN